MRKFILGIILLNWPVHEHLLDLRKMVIKTCSFTHTNFRKIKNWLHRTSNFQLYVIVCVCVCAYECAYSIFIFMFWEVNEAFCWKCFLTLLVGIKLILKKLTINRVAKMLVSKIVSELRQSSSVKKKVII